MDSTWKLSILMQNDPAINMKILPKSSTLAWNCMLMRKPVSEVKFPENKTTKLEYDQGEPKAK